VTNHLRLATGRASLVALDVALQLVATLHELELPRGLCHLRDHLIRAADNTVLRLSEASGRTMGHRHQHLEAAYAENQEVQSDLILMATRGVEVPPAALCQADRLGGLVYGLLRAEVSSRSR
jgi:hypothetical protein